MVFSQIPDGLPEIGLRGTAEDLRRGEPAVRGLSTKQKAAAPHAILGAPDRDPNGDVLTAETDGGKLMNDWLSRVG